jgi:hypothetical protein
LPASKTSGIFSSSDGTEEKAMPTVTVRDETTAGAVTHELTIDVLTESITVRDLIRARVYQEVDDFNRRGREIFNGLVQPTDTERTPAGYKLRTARRLDWRPQFDRACEAFEKNLILLVTDDRQAESLDETLTLRADSRVSFLKLVPLVGG